MNNTTNDWNPDDFEALPAELFADENEQLMTHAEEEEVVDTISNFLNIEGAEFGEQVYNSLVEGNSDPIKVLLMIKKMQHLHDFFLGSDASRTNKTAKQYLKDKIVETVGKETYKAYGASISIETIGGSTTMDYKECGDLYLNRLYELQNQIKDMVKEREAFIKKELPPNSSTLGIRGHKATMSRFPSIEFSNIEPQVYNIVPPIKYSREGIVVRFPRKKK